jgi:DNA-binding NarL/FixJ family response regulator
MKQITVLLADDNKLVRRDIQESAKSGAAGYLIKHTAINNLCRAIRQVHQGKTFFKSPVPHHLHQRVVIKSKPAPPP